MVVEATGSKFTRNGRFYLAALCLAGALWFGYDGWVGSYRQDELEKNDGKPTPNLLFNMYAPVPMVMVAVIAVCMGLRSVSKKIVSDEHGLTFSSGKVIPYSGIRKIDKTSLQKSGCFTIAYTTGSAVKTLKLSDRHYDNLAELLDEIVRQTGAVPEGENPTGSTAINGTNDTDPK